MGNHPPTLTLPRKGGGNIFFSRACARYAFSIAVITTLFFTLTASPAQANFTITKGTFTMNGTLPVFRSTGSIVIGPNGVFTANGGSITLSGNWNNSGIFNTGTSTVTFYDVGASSLTGNTTFNVLVCVTGGKTMYFQQNSTQGILTVLNLNGGSSSTDIFLRPTTSGSTYFIRLASSQTVQFVDVAQSSAMAANPSKPVYINGTNSVNSGGNSNWIFPSVPNAPSNLAQFSGSLANNLSFGSWERSPGIIITSFTINSNNPVATLQFNVNFSSYSDFHFQSLTATSPATATLSQGATSFATTLLGMGTWYWRVNATDNSGNSGSYTNATVANNINFGIDYTSPTNQGISSVSSWVSSETINLSVAVDTISGLQGNSSQIRYSTSTDFLNTISTVSGWFAGWSTQTTGGLTPNTSYFIQAQAESMATNISSWIAGGGVSTFTSVTLAAAPTANAFTAAGWSTNSITFSWSANNNPSNTVYTAYTSTWSDFVAYSSSITTLTSISSTTLSLHTTYFFQVKAQNYQNVATAWSATLSTPTYDPYAPDQISNLTAITGNGSGDILLSWTAPGNDGNSNAINNGHITIVYQGYAINNNSDFSNATTFITISTNITPGINQGYDVTGLTSGSVYYFAVKYQDDAGNWANWSQSAGINSASSATASGHLTPAVDGTLTGWMTAPASLPYNAATFVNGEWIWKDKVGEDRTDAAPVDRGNFDITDIHVWANSTDIYWMVKFQNITDINTTYIGISIDTGDASANMSQKGVLWGPGDSSGMEQGANYGGFQVHVTRQIVVHSTSTGWTGISYWDGENGSTWYDPPNGYNTYDSPTNDALQFRMNRADLALTGSRVFRFTLCSFENIVARTGVSGVVNFNPGALDSMSIMRYWNNNDDTPHRNDWESQENAWWEGIDISTADFWVQISLDSNGTVATTAAGAPTLSAPANAISTNTLTPSLSWTAPSAPASPNAVTSYLVELGTSTTLSGPAAWRINVPSSSTTFKIPSNLQNNTTYYWQVSTRDRTGQLTASSQFSFVTNNTSLALGSGTYPFNHTISSSKDTRWGTNPIATSPQNMAPAAFNLASDLYVTNDAGYIYFGWIDAGDPWTNSINPDMEFILETNGDFRGTNYDPINPGTTKINWTNRPDWVADVIQQDGGTTLTNAYLYQTISSATPGVMSWSSGSPLASSEFAGDSNSSWAELRLPLNKLNLTTNKLVNILMAARPGSGSPPTGFTANAGWCDSTPWDFGDTDVSNSTSASATTDYAHVKNGFQATFDSTASVTYRIQYATMDAEHTPNSAGVGQTTMRNPLIPDSNTSPSIQISINPQGVFQTGTVYYSTGNVWGSTNSAAMGGATNSGSNEYRTATISNFVNSTVVHYYAVASANGMDTYIMGPGDGQTFTTRFATVALNNAWSYTVTKGSPTAPSSVSLSPSAPTTSNNLYCTANAATADSDGDPVTFINRWYRNGLLFTTTFQTMLTSTRPSVDTTTGDQWFCTVQSSGITGLLSTISTSNAVAVLNQVWVGTATTKVNVSTLSGNEFIITDKTGDASQGDADLTEARMKFDSNKVYFLFTFSGLTDGNNPFVAITIDTNSIPGSGSNFVGSGSNLTLGVGYSTAAGTNTGGYMARWERQIILHSTASAANSFCVEISSAGQWVTADPNVSSAAVYVSANKIEAAINRADLGLSGNVTAQFSIATFINSPGRAANGSASPGNGNDSISIVQISTNSNPGGYTNDPSNSLTATQEELGDGDLDYWVRVVVDASGNILDYPPPPPSSPVPSIGGSTTSFTPGLSWQETVSGAGYAVTSYLLELNNSTQLDGTVLYRVNVSSNNFTIPSSLTGQTTYYWRVWARNQKGVLAQSTATWSFLVQSEIPYANIPQTVLNTDNYGQHTGLESANNNVAFNWAPATVISYPITNYICDVSSSSSFNFYISSDVGTALQSTFTALSRGQYWYSRLKAKNTAGVTGPVSSVSNPILVNARDVDGDVSDWGTGSFSSNTANIVSNGPGNWPEMVWQDAVGDERLDGVNPSQLDLSTFAVTCDARNLYMYMTFASTVSSGFDGRGFIQVGISNGPPSNHYNYRVFQGYNNQSGDVYASGDTPINWRIQMRTGTGDCIIKNGDFSYQKTEAYAEISSNYTIEAAVPLADLGGANTFLGQTVDFTVIVSSQDGSGSVANYNQTIATPHAADVISNLGNSSGTGTSGTWSAVSGQVLNYYLAVTFNANGSVAAANGVTPAVLASVPNQIALDNTVAQSVRDHILVNLFLDKFYNGDTTNDNPQDPNLSGGSHSSGGDFIGLMDKVNLFNTMGINTIYFSSLIYFGGWGIWGYDIKDPFRVEDRFGGYYDYMKCMKYLKWHNLNATMDLVPGQAGLNYPGVQNHPNAYSLTTQNFGSQMAYVGQAEHQQLWWNVMDWFMSTGMVGFRWDNPKYWVVAANGPQGDRHVSLRVLRNKMDKDYPGWWSYGEEPGGGDVDNYYYNYATTLGLELYGAEDFNTTTYGGANTIGGTGCDSSSGVGRNWLYNPGDNTTNTGSVLRNQIENADGANNKQAQLNASRWLNHDNGRWWSSANGSVGNYIVGYALEYGVGTEPPIQMYGDDLCGVQAQSCSKAWCNGSNWCWNGGGTDPYPWGAGNCSAGSWGNRTMNRLVQARAIFPALRRSPYNGGRYGFNVDGSYSSDIIAYDRKATEQSIGPRILVIVNRGTAHGTISIPVTSDGWSNGDLAMDWMCSNSPMNCGYNATVSGGNLSFTMDGGNVREFVEGGFGISTFTGVISNLPAGQTGVVDVDGNSVWTTDTDSVGSFTVTNVITAYNGTTSHTIHAWAPGLGLLTQTTTFTAGGTTVLTGNNALSLPAAWSPQPPTGVGGQARDRAVNLWWTNRTEAEASSYYVYYALQPGGPYTFAMEALNSPIYFSGANDQTGNYGGHTIRIFETFLTNGVTYYWVVRTANRDGTLSPLSNEIALQPHKVSVTFWMDARNGLGGGVGVPAYIRGNCVPLGPGLPDAATGEPGQSSVQMTNNNNGTYQYTTQIDPTSYIRYVYTLNGSANSNKEFCTSSEGCPNVKTYSEIGTDGNLSWARGVERGIMPNQPPLIIKDSGDGTQTIVNVYQNLGDNYNYGSVAPNPPTNLSLASSNGTLSLGWAKCLEPDVIQYQIDRGPSGGPYSQIAKTDGNTLKYIDQNLTNGTTYQYRVRSVNRYQKVSGNSSLVSGFPTSNSLTPPAVPSGMIAYAPSASTIQIAWTANSEPDLAGYDVYRSTLSGDPTPAKLTTSLVQPVQTPTFNDNAVSPGVTYYYWLDAQDYAGNTSTKSVQFSAYLVNITFQVNMGGASPSSVGMIGVYTPFASGIPTSQQSAGSQIWQALTGQIAGSFMRYRYTTTIGTNTYTERNFTNTGSGDREITISFSTNQTISNNWEETPDVPTNIRIYPDDSSCWVYWTKVFSKDVVGYQIYDPSGNKYSPVVSSNPIQVTGLTNGTAYTLGVRSVDGGFSSATSATVTVTPNASINVIFKGARPRDKFETADDRKRKRS